MTTAFKLPTDTANVTMLLNAIAANPECEAAYSAAVDAMMEEMGLIPDEAHMRAGNVRDVAIEPHSNAVWEKSHLARFHRAYMRAALFTSTVDDAGTPMDRDHTVWDIHPDTQRSMRADGLLFLSWCAHLIEGNYTGTNRDGDGDFAMVGRHFWMTRCGCGTGFWDGDWINEDDILSDTAKSFGEDYLVVGDDGQIHAY